ncbi:unnamed protein product [Moneuplotes crassus]|uniref:Uncharacterized protein n=1 Tax=Euplotes crassus TaxID=5936 RepID=A0AAD2D135_EUPCR|nr:unnamed protein product [Moneuplotes crassus]
MQFVLHKVHFKKQKACLILSFWSLPSHLTTVIQEILTSNLKIACPCYKTKKTHC